MAENNGVRIPMQVGTEFRIKSNGDIVLGNPELELASDTAAADAVLLYHFDPRTKEHTLRLLDPVADHEHLRNHRKDD